MASLISCGGQRALTTAMASGLWRHEDCSMHPNGAMYVLPRISSPCHHSFSSPASPAHLRRRSASLHPPLRHLLRSATSPHQHFRFAASYLAASASRSTSSLQVLASPPALPQQYFFKACSLFFSSFFRAFVSSFTHAENLPICSSLYSSPLLARINSARFASSALILIHPLFSDACRSCSYLWLALRRSCSLLLPIAYS
jgi:hypothetical protein